MLECRSNWRKAAASGQTDCVEVRCRSRVNGLTVGGLVDIRDTKNRDGGMLSVSGAEFSRFIGAIKEGPLSEPR
ncbi:DUF397 domain-containing protein [Actinoalloteichus sp. GBA129-24]|uniref:DUF397 domain-containing protein n=1 Tax=Actinoalloteichus sp. GBA129-24 TaxID=1612551 RepID=UPI00095039F0|nr:DUF397 domain-containing protein [Actinoalloteichus sp. GBA129-24]APU18955.1 putative DUF397 family protein [Actinoalloteichus sp. GBA129-24]